MSRAAPRPHEARALTVTCPYCKVGPGIWCLTDRGVNAFWLHQARIVATLRR